MLKTRSIGFLKVFIFPNSKANEPWHICKETRLIIYLYLNQSPNNCLTDNREVHQFLRCDSSDLIWESTLRVGEMHSRNTCFSPLAIKGIYTSVSGIDRCVLQMFISDQMNPMLDVRMRHIQQVKQLLK